MYDVITFHLHKNCKTLSSTFLLPRFPFWYQNSHKVILAGNTLHGSSRLVGDIWEGNSRIWESKWKWERRAKPDTSGFSFT